MSCEATDYGYLEMNQVANTIYNNGSYIVVGGSGAGEHAFVLFGYSQEMMTYTYWNPWFGYTQTMDADTRVMQADNNTVYVWDAGYIRNIG